MNDDRDDLLDEIGRALAVEPSPDFRARVRQRLEPEGGRRLRWFWTGGVAAAAVLAAAVVAQRAPGFAGPWRAPATETVRVSESAPAVARPVPPSPVERADDAHVPAARRAAAVSSTAGLAADEGGNATPGSRPRTRADDAARADADFAAVLASVQVDPSQLDGLRRIAAAASRRPVAPVVVPPPIEIPPIVIASLDPPLVPGVTP